VKFPVCFAVGFPVKYIVGSGAEAPWGFGCRTRRVMDCLSLDCCASLDSKAGDSMQCFMQLSCCHCHAHLLTGAVLVPSCPAFVVCML
jgi:hypothetical protein